jgi:hypothetical protein
LILDPLDNRFRLFCKLAFVLAKLSAADIDAAFVLILIIFVFPLLCVCGFRAAFGLACIQVCGLTFSGVFPKICFYPCLFIA